jgi:hypothetical protein
VKPLEVTLKNISESDITLKPNAKSDEITILDGSTPLWHTRKLDVTTKAHTLHTGQTIRLSAAWNGKFTEPGLKALGTEVLTIQVDYGGYTADGTVEVK